MKGRRRKWHGGRALLNRAGFHSTAAVVAEVEDSSIWEPGKDGDGDEYSARWLPTPAYTFQIANCDRSISLELDFSSVEAQANDLYKLDLLIDSLQKFRAGVAVEQTRYNDRKRRAKE